jgi:hypothetical protein
VDGPVVIRAIGGAAALAAALTAATAAAQISPGPLSRVHAGLEGSGRCLDCHDADKGVAPGKCLACHKPLAQRIAGGKGLHARPEYRDCKTCHVEHQGVEYQLVWWGKAGRGAFDHAQTGHALAGKHRTLSCEQCHKQRSFLGAVTDCASCHRDEHRGQFPGRACSSCHTEQAWKPVPGFDHARTSWPLTGRHAPVACERCHTARRPDASTPGASYRVFRAVAGRDCTSCHQDAHAGRLGTSCSTCHTTAGWRSTSTPKDFDHQRTAYPLTGRHATVACDRCHRPGRPLRLKHDACTDCHADAHAGQLARRADGGRCESCHDVSGFRPARYSPEDHAKSSFPLKGAHLAVACDQCHRPRVAGAGRAAVELRIATTRCADCHRDPHRGQVATLVAAGGCESCHAVGSWREISFDHSHTKYALSGRHAQVACAPCHRRPEPGGAAPVLRFAGAPQACEGCHRDPHLGQFARAGAVSCERCHTTADLKASRFDHSRDAAYPLDGAHARLACTACHLPQTRDGVRFTRYKPLPTTCRGCHGPAGRPAAEGRP